MIELHILAPLNAYKSKQGLSMFLIMVLCAYATFKDVAGQAKGQPRARRLAFASQ